MLRGGSRIGLFVMSLLNVQMSRDNLFLWFPHSLNQLNIIIEIDSAIQVGDFGGGGGIPKMS